jgi:hypothetical protein
MQRELLPEPTHFLLLESEYQKLSGSGIWLFPSSPPEVRGLLNPIGPPQETSFKLKQTLFYDLAN